MAEETNTPNPQEEEILAGATESDLTKETKAVGKGSALGKKEDTPVEETPQAEETTEKATEEAAPEQKQEQEAPAPAQESGKTEEDLDKDFIRKQRRLDEVRSTRAADATGTLTEADDADILVKSAELIEHGMDSTAAVRTAAELIRLGKTSNQKQETPADKQAEVEKQAEKETSISAKYTSLHPHRKYVSDEKAEQRAAEDKDMETLYRAIQDQDFEKPI